MRNNDNNITKFYVLLRLLYNKVAASNDFFSWLRRVHVHVHRGRWITEFRIFMTFQYSGVAASTDCLWSTSAHISILVTTALPNFMFFSD